MVVAKANLALQTAPLSEFVATATLVVFGVEDLAGSLVFELIVFAQESHAKRAFENSAAVVPDASLTFDTNGVDQGTRATMLRNALTSVADERFTMVTNTTGQLDSGDIGLTMFHKATAGRFIHALSHSATAANHRLLQHRTEITKCSIFL